MNQQSRKKIKPPVDLQGPSDRLNWWLDINFWPPRSNGRVPEICRRTKVGKNAAAKYVCYDSIPRKREDKLRISEALGIPLAFWEYGDPSELKAFNAAIEDDDILKVVEFTVVIERRAVIMNVKLSFSQIENIRKLAVTYANIQEEQSPNIEIITNLIELSQKGG